MMHRAPPRHLAALFLLAIASSTGWAEEKPEPPSRVFVHATANYHLESRDFVGYASGFDLLAGADFLIWRAGELYAGPRVGWYAETVCTAYLAPTLAMRQTPSLGGEIYFVYPSRRLKALSSTAGRSVDVLVNLDDLHSEPTERTYTFLGCFLGLRFALPRSFYAETRLEAGLFPFFDAIPIFVKGGVQIGYSLLVRS